MSIYFAAIREEYYDYPIGSDSLIDYSYLKEFESDEEAWSYIDLLDRGFEEIPEHVWKYNDEIKSWSFTVIEIDS